MMPPARAGTRSTSPSTRSNPGSASAEPNAPSSSTSVQSRDPEKAARIANAIGDAYFAEEAGARTDTARRASDALTGRLASLKRDVEQAEGAVVRTGRITSLWPRADACSPTSSSAT